MQKYKVVAFDCDGTLVDTFKLIEQTVILTFEEMFPNYNISIEEVHAFFGPFLEDSFAKYVTTKEEIAECVEKYRQINNRLMPKYIRCYDGIKELLEYLKNNDYKVAIVSNKVSPAIIYGLELCNIDSYIDLIIGAEMIVPKPDSDGINKIREYFNTQDVIYVGDMKTDIETGKNAGIPSVGVTWCKTSKEEFKQIGATYIIDHPLELIKILEEN